MVTRKLVYLSLQNAVLDPNPKLDDRVTRVQHPLR